MANTGASEPVEVYVAPQGSFTITADNGGAGLDAGDVVTWNGEKTIVPNLTFGGDAFLSIQSAVDAVCAEGTVFLAAGNYDEGAEILIEKALTIQGDGMEATVLSGGSNGDMVLDAGEHRVMAVDIDQNAKVTLSHLSMVDGVAIDNGTSSRLNLGGAIYQVGGILEIRNCSLSRHFAHDDGGAIYCDSSFDANHVLVVDSVFADNTANSGGAIYVRDGFFDIKGSVFRANKAVLVEESGVNGGALAYRGDESFIQDTVFEANTAEDQGGAIYQFGDALRLTRVVFKANQAERGGGLYSRDEVVMESVQFLQNVAQTGGGMVNFSGAVMANHLNFIGNRAVAPSGVFGVSATGGGMENRSDFTVTNLTVRDNAATFVDPSTPGFGASADGGGIANNFGVFSATNASFSNNSAEHDGGGLYSQFGSISLQNVSIINNTAKEDGGGIRIDSESARLLQCTISGNQTEADGAGLYDASDLFEMIHCTVTNNSTTGDGGGVYRSGSETVTTIVNSLIAGNTAAGSSDDIYGDFMAGGVNFIGLPNAGFNGFRNSVDLSFASSSASSVDDLFTPLSNNGGRNLTHALVVGSAAINAGGNAAVPANLTMDQRGDGFVRIFNTTVDIGALEFGDKGAELSLKVVKILPDRSVVLEVALVPGQAYRLEYSEDLVGFTPMLENIIAMTNTLQVTDSGLPLTPTPPSQKTRRFYRVVHLRD